MPLVGYKHTEEALKKMRESHLGTHHTPERCIKIGESNKGKIMSLTSREKISRARTGMKFSETHVENLIASHKGKYMGSDSSSWKGGVSFEPYCPKFNNEFKERVRAFFGYCCVECGCHQSGYITITGKPRKLSIHHVNFRKDSCCAPDAPRLFVPLCPTCHMKTNHNRIFWEYWFTEFISRIYDGKCYFSKEEMIDQ